MILADGRKTAETFNRLAQNFDRSTRPAQERILGTATP